MSKSSEAQTSAAPSTPREGAFVGQWWLISGFWLLLTLAVVLKESLEFPYDLSHGLQAGCTRWLPWVFLTPLISWLTSHYRLHAAAWPGTIGVYLVACALVISGMAALAYSSDPYLRDNTAPYPRAEHERKEGFERFHGPHGREHFPQEGMASPPPGPSRFSGPDQKRTMTLGLVRQALIQLPIFWLVVLSLHGLDFYQQAKERERHEAELESSLTLARLQALRMQLNPHFLFNTLNSIASLVYENPKAADEMIASLSELLRLTLNSTDRQEASLREEVHLLDLYLRIEQTRFGERLRVQKEIEPAALDAMVPILILQPLMENAIKHGVQSRLGAGIVSVLARPANGSLLLQIADNGKGPIGTQPGGIKEGVGIGNTRARLQVLYGEKSSLEIRRPESGGCLVEIKIPWRTLFTGAAPAEKRT